MDFEAGKYEMYKNKIKNINNETIFIDNGTYEIKAGVENELGLITTNFAYKKGKNIQFDVVSGSTKISMFDYDIVSQIDVAEHIFKLVFDNLNVETKNKKLVLTITPEMPTTEEFVQMLFTTFQFKQISLGYDFVFAFRKYFKTEDVLIVNISASNTFVCFIKNREIVYLHKLEFGATELLEYIKNTMQFRFKDFRKEYALLLNKAKVAYDFQTESIDVLHSMYAGKYDKTVFLEDKKTVSHDTISVVATNNETVKKSKEFVLPEIDIDLVFANDEDLDAEKLTEKKRQKLMYFSTLARLKTKVKQEIGHMEDVVDENVEELEKSTNFEKYLKRKKEKFEELKKVLKDREILRKNANNRKTLESVIKHKEKNFTDEEQELQNKIFDAEDMGKEQELIDELNDRVKKILEMDPDFVPFYASTVEILRGENINRECIAAEPLKWGEIFFNPAILKMNQMGLSELFQDVSKQFSIENVFITGGLAHMSGLKERVYKELICRSKTGKINIKVCENTQTDAFYGAHEDFCIKTYNNSK